MQLFVCCFFELFTKSLKLLMVLLFIGVEVAEDARFKSTDLHLLALILPGVFALSLQPANSSFQILLL